jgi:hypothetical protein
MMKKYLKINILLVPLIGGILFGYNNCARYNQLNDAATTASASTAGDEVNSEKLGFPFALLSAEQTLSSMMKVTNIMTASAALKNEYNIRYGALAAGNDFSMVNGPLMLGSTSLAGEVCNSLLKQEKAITEATARSFFGSINFASGVSSLTDSDFNATVRGMARSFWGRNETTEELTLLQQYKVDFIDALAEKERTTAVSTSNLVIASCAAMLSSIDAISY